MVSRRHRRGLTLTELLVVIAILVTVTAVLAPLLAPSFEGREIREAARQVNAYFQQARARAKELGRPVGVMIRRGQPGNPEFDFGYQLSLAEEPPPYTGVTSFSRAKVEVLNGVPTGFAELQDAADPNSFQRFVQPNDTIRFNLRGPKYRILEIGKATLPGYNYRIHFDTYAQPVSNYASHNSVQFEVFRRPRATTSTPLELPTGTAIVMNLSGVGMDFVSPGIDGEEPMMGSNPRKQYIGLTEFQRATAPRLSQMPLVIMFSPSGSVDRIYRVLPPPGQEHTPLFARMPPKRPQDKLYLFLGRDGVDHWTNLNDSANIWVTIDPQNGAVNTSPNALPPEAMASMTDINARLRAVALSRQLASTGQNMGGR